MESSVKHLVLLCVLLASLGAGVRTVARAERLVYVGTYTAEFNANSTSKGIYAFRLNDDTGALTPLGLAATSINPSYLTASADGRFLFAVNELQTYQGEPGGFVTSYAIDKATGMLTELSSQPSKGAGPCHLALDKTGRYLAVANYNGGNYALFPVGVDGKLSPVSQLVTGDATMGADGTTPMKALAHMVLFDATNRYLVASDKGLNKLLVFAFDASKGTLTPNTPPAVAIPQPKFNPRHFVFDPAQRFVYSLGESAAAVTSFAWDAKTGTLTPGSSVSTRPPGVATGSTAEIRMHPSGKFLYASNRSSPSTIAVFSIGANGALTLVEHEQTRGNTARGVNIDPTGKWLISGNQGTNTVVAFRIDQTTGALDPVGDPQPVGMPVDVVFVN